MTAPRPRSSATHVTQASPCTWLRLRKLSRQLTNFYDQGLAPFGLTVTQWSLLAHLKSLDGIGLGALAEALVMDPTALTRALRPLQRDGLVRLQANPQDKRARHLHLTDKGRERYEAARPAWRRAQLHVDDILQARDLTALNGLLDHLIDDMKSAPASPTGDRPCAGKEKA